jgi:hypothetical protein
MPPVSGCSRVERVDCCTGRVERDDGVMLSRNASAPEPEKWCWTLNCQLIYASSSLSRCIHMPDIKQTGLLTCPVVRVNNAEVAVLHGHGIAAKRHKLGAILAVKLIQPSLAYFLLSCLRRRISGLVLVLLGGLAGSCSLT